MSNLIKYRGILYRAVATTARSADTSSPSFYDLFLNEEIGAPLFFVVEDYYLAEAYGLDLAVRRAVKAVAVERAKAKFDAMVARLAALDGTECYRVISLAHDVDPVGLTNLGQYWSTDKGGVRFASGSNTPGITKKYVYSAKIDISSVDKWKTIVGMFEVPLEHMVRFTPGASIFVYSVEDEVGSRVDINAERKI